jgi:ADP-ribose pyrophosphatase
MADEIQIKSQGKYIELAARGHWEFARRRNTSGIVAIVALTPRRELLLVEQYRAPLNCRVVELPAGLAGDIPGEEDEDFSSAARRELEEETGYAASDLQPLGMGPPSAGMTTELVTFYRAEGLRKIGAGGGDPSEEIQVHLVALDGLASWLEERRGAGCLIDLKVYAGLFLAGHTRDLGRASSP